MPDTQRPGVIRAVVVSAAGSSRRARSRAQPHRVPDAFDSAGIPPCKPTRRRSQDPFRRAPRSCPTRRTIKPCAPSRPTTCGRRWRRARRRCVAASPVARRDIQQRPDWPGTSAAASTENGSGSSFRPVSGGNDERRDRPIGSRDDHIAAVPRPLIRQRRESSPRRGCGHPGSTRYVRSGWW